jgi:hypothetical protein
MYEISMEYAFHKRFFIRPSVDRGQLLDGGRIICKPERVSEMFFLEVFSNGYLAEKWVKKVSFLIVDFMDEDFFSDLS